MSEAAAVPVAKCSVILPVIFASSGRVERSEAVRSAAAAPDRDVRAAAMSGLKSVCVVFASCAQIDYARLQRARQLPARAAHP